MPDPNVYMDHDPMQALSQSLSLALLASAAAREAVNFMEFPPGKWNIRVRTLHHLHDVDDTVKELLDFHTEIRAQLKAIGY